MNNKLHGRQTDVELTKLKMSMTPFGCAKEYEGMGDTSKGKDENEYKVKDPNFCTYLENKTHNHFGSYLRTLGNNITKSRRQPNITIQQIDATCNSRNSNVSKNNSS